MGTLMDKLNATNATKEQIRQAIERKKVTIPTSTPLKDYPAKIDGIYPDALFLENSNHSVKLPPADEINSKIRYQLGCFAIEDGFVFTGKTRGSDDGSVVAFYRNGAWNVKKFAEPVLQVARCKKGLLLCGNSYYTSTTAYYTSDFGVTMEKTILPFAPIIVCRGDNYNDDFFLVTDASSNFAISYDGKKWEALSCPVTIARDLWKTNDIYYFVGDSQTKCTKDFKNWHDVVAGKAQSYESGRYTPMVFSKFTNKYYMVIGYDILESEDGIKFSKNKKLGGLDYYTGALGYKNSRFFVSCSGANNPFLPSGSGKPEVYVSQNLAFLEKHIIPFTVDPSYSGGLFYVNIDYDTGLMVAMAGKSLYDETNLCEYLISYDGITWGNSATKGLFLEDASGNNRTQDATLGLYDGFPSNQTVSVLTLNEAYMQGVNSI